MSEKLSVIIVDDERPARELLVEYLAADARFSVQGTCAGGAEAIKTIRAGSPDLVLLDVQMPEVDGFDVLAALGETMPTVIMVTAYHEHAVRAFDAHALDYVLKPVDEARLRLALDRAALRVGERRAGQMPAGLQQFVRALGPEAAPAPRLVLKTPGSFLFIDPQELAWIEVSKNYLRLHCADDTYRQRSTIGELLARLDPAWFVRIHRSYAVNRAHVREVRSAPGGSDLSVVLRDGRTLPVGRSYREGALARLMQS